MSEKIAVIIDHDAVIIKNHEDTPESFINDAFATFAMRYGDVIMSDMPQAGVSASYTMPLDIFNKARKAWCADAESIEFIIKHVTVDNMISAEHFKRIPRVFIVSGRSMMRALVDKIAGSGLKILEYNENFCSMKVIKRDNYNYLEALYKSVSKPVEIDCCDSVFLDSSEFYAMIDNTIRKVREEIANDDTTCVKLEKLYN